jgi:hypothetical protein
MLHHLAKGGRPRDPSRRRASALRVLPRIAWRRPLRQRAQPRRRHARPRIQRSRLRPPLPIGASPGPIRIPKVHQALARQQRQRQRHQRRRHCRGQRWWRSCLLVSRSAARYRCHGSGRPSMPLPPWPQAAQCRCRACVRPRLPPERRRPLPLRLTTTSRAWPAIRTLNRHCKTAPLSMRTGS